MKEHTMNWEFRIINNQYDHDKYTNIVNFFTIHKVFLNDDGSISNIDKKPYVFAESSLDITKDNIIKLYECLNKPIIKYANGKQY